MREDRVLEIRDAHCMHFLPKNSFSLKTVQKLTILDLYDIIIVYL